MKLIKFLTAALLFSPFPYTQTELDTSFQPGWYGEINYIVLPEVDDPLFDNTSYDSNLFMFSVGKSF